MSNIMAYLFGDSQIESELDDTRERIDQILESAEASEPIKAKKTPLTAALKSIGISGEGELELDPEGFCMTFTQDDVYRKACAALGDPDAMEKLAEMGWVAHKLGDSAMTNEPAEFRIRFIEITTAETTDADKSSETLDAVIKKGREFATKPLDRDDDENPVEHPEAPDKKQAGISKVKDGADPKGTPKTGKSKSEALELVDAQLDGTTPAIEDAPGTDLDAEPARFDDVQEALAKRRGRPHTVKDNPVANKLKKGAQPGKAYKTPRK